MGYSETMHKQQKVYSPELGYTFQTSRCKVFENTPGSTINLRLRCEAGPNGTSNDHPDRMPRGRPKQQQADQQPAPLKVKLIPQVVILTLYHHQTSRDL